MKLEGLMTLAILLFVCFVTNLAAEYLTAFYPRVAMAILGFLMMLAALAIVTMLTLLLIGRFFP